MSGNAKLEETVSKILNQSQTDFLNQLKENLAESTKNLADSQVSLEQEYDRIIDDGKKESEKIEKKIIGSSDLESRNKQLLLVEESIEKVFAQAIEKIKSAKRDDNYSKLIATLIEEATSALDTSDVTVSTNSNDKKIVKSVLKKFSGAKLSSDSIECLGGIVVKSKDGTMTFNNTIDERLERLKPLIRKKIASNFGIGN